MKDCKNCEYRKYIAKVFDMHIDSRDCWLEKCVLENKEENEDNNASEFILKGEQYDGI